MRVLIIDDEDDVRTIASLSLARVGGMAVTEARSGREGLERATEDPPDLILLDMMMPGMDGATTFQALQENAVTRTIPVIFLTAKAMSGEVERLRQLGARGLVLKPFNPMTLATEIRSVLDQG